MVICGVLKFSRLNIQHIEMFELVIHQYLLLKDMDNQLGKQTALKMALNILIIATVKVFLAN